MRWGIRDLGFWLLTLGFYGFLAIIGMTLGLLVAMTELPH